MNFLYHYPLDSNGRLKYDNPIHIAAKGDILYLCGLSIFSNISSRIEQNALPYISLCSNCKLQCRRLTADEPTEKQMVEWWNGGIDEFRKEINQT